MNVKKNLKYLWKYSVVFLLIIVALNQMRLVMGGLSRWRGGGFGMYSETHWLKTQIWIVDENQEVLNLLDSLYSDIPNRTEILLRIKEFPNQKNVDRLAKSLYRKKGLSSFTIQVWQPYLDERTLEYRRQLLKNYEYKNMDQSLSSSGN